MITIARPFKYTPEELEEACNRYFKDRIDTEKKVNFCSIRDLCSFLDIDKQTLYNYEHRPSYSPVVKRARDKILTVWEQQLLLPGRNTTGAIFYLKNYGGMADKVEHQVQGKIDHQHTARLNDIDQEKLEALSDALRQIVPPAEQDVIDIDTDNQDEPE